MKEKPEKRRWKDEGEELEKKCIKVIFNVSLREWKFGGVGDNWRSTAFFFFFVRLRHHFSVKGH